MKKNEVKAILQEKGIAFDESLTLAQLQALVPTAQSSDQVWVIPTEKPRKENNFRLPVVDTPTALNIETVRTSTSEANKDRRFLVLSLGDEWFRMWNDEFHGALTMEQERLDKAGTGFRLFTVNGEETEIPKSVEFTCNGRYLTVNA